MCRSIVCIVVITIFHNEIQRTYQSEIQSPIPTNDITETSYTDRETTDTFINKPKDTIENNENKDISTITSNAINIESNKNTNNEFTKPIDAISKDATGNTIKKEFIEDISDSKNAHKMFTKDQKEIDESRQSLEDINNDSKSGNNSNDMDGQNNKTEEVSYLAKPRDVHTDDSSYSIRRMMTSSEADKPNGSFTSIPPMSFLQRFSGRMVIPIFKAHQKYSGGVSKGVHGMQEVGSGTIDIAKGTIDLIKDTARSIFDINL